MADDMQDKCIEFLKKLGIYENEEKLIEFTKEFSVICENGEFQAVKKSELHKLDILTCVLCAPLDPFTPLRPGCRIGECDDCNTPIVISPDSPNDPPNLCPGCAINRANKEEDDE